MHVHTTHRYHVCTDCGAQLCTHHHHSLRGCMLEDGHEGFHFNPNCNDDFYWSDFDGTYINSQQDWIDHVGRLADDARARCAT